MNAAVTVIWASPRFGHPQPVWQAFEREGKGRERNARGARGWRESPYSLAPKTPSPFLFKSLQGRLGHPHSQNPSDVGIPFSYYLSDLGQRQGYRGYPKRGDAHITVTLPLSVVHLCLYRDLCCCFIIACLSVCLFVCLFVYLFIYLLFIHSFWQVGLSTLLAKARDLFEHKNLGTFKKSFKAKVNPSGVIMVKLSPIQDEL